MFQSLKKKKIQTKTVLGINIPKSCKKDQTNILNILKSHYPLTLFFNKQQEVLDFGQGLH